MTLNMFVYGEYANINNSRQIVFVLGYFLNHFFKKKIQFVAENRASLFLCSVINGVRDFPDFRNNVTIIMKNLGSLTH